MLPVTPTMGALHAGHASLMDLAAAETDFVVVSIFVNPTQFAPSEDLAAYPRTPREDADLCREHKVDLILAPSVQEIYGGGSATEVTVKSLSATLCGRSRPTHFAGVCTIVAKLFNIVQPSTAFFGAKDFQQVAIIRRMVNDLNFPLVVRLCPTVREADGLAMSSRNKYLSPEERQQAPALYEALKLAGQMIRRDRPPVSKVIEAMRAHLSARATLGAIDYIQIVDPSELTDLQRTDRPVLIALAVKFGKARLIDNMLVD